MTDTVFEVAINNSAPGQRDEAKLCTDTLAQVDGWQCEGINESTGPPTHGDGSSADGLMSSLYSSVRACRCVCVYARMGLALQGLNLISTIKRGRKTHEHLIRFGRALNDIIL